MWIVHGAGSVTAALRYCFRPVHHERLAKRAEVAGRFGLGDVFAVGVIGAAVKEAEASAARDHLTVGAHIALHSG